MKPPIPWLVPFSNVVIRMTGPCPALRCFTHLVCSVLFAAVLLVGNQSQAADTTEPVGISIEQVNELVAQLDGDKQADRDDAAQRLVALAGKTPQQAERLLALLPATQEAMPPAIRTGLDSVRKQVQLVASSIDVNGSLITLNVKQSPLTEVLKSIQQQSGNRIRDNRENFGQEVDDLRITLAVEEAPFWPTFDNLLDQAKLDIYAYGGQGEMALINRTDGLRKRSEGVAYSGPFRFEPLRVVSTRGLRDTSESAIDVHIEVSWEPKLTPIVLTQRLDEIEVIDDGGIPVLTIGEQESIDLEVVPGSQAIDFVLPLELSLRLAESIESIKGTLHAVVPGKRHTFTFEEIAEQKVAKKLTQGDATVTFEKFFKNNAIWELQMRIQIDNAGEALASHRGWIFDNASYLMTPDGRRIDHVGIETTLQTESEIGLAFLFDLANPDYDVMALEAADAEGVNANAAADDAVVDAAADGEEQADTSEQAKPTDAAIDPKQLKWIYVSPTGVMNMPIEYELKEIPLP